MSTDPTTTAPSRRARVRPAVRRRGPAGPTLAYVRLEVVRTLRNPRAVLLTVLVPILLLVVLSGQADGDERRVLLADMAAYGALGGGLFATGPRLVAERANGWLRQLRATPLSPSAAIVGKGAAGLLSALLSSFVLGGVGCLGGFGLSVGQWLGLTVALTLCGTVTTALGLLIGAAVRSPETAQGATMVAYVLPSALGGLWVPPDQFPGWLHSVAQTLPTYHVGVVARAITAGDAVGVGHCAIIAAWAVALGAAASLAWRRGTRVR